MKKSILILASILTFANSFAQKRKTTTTRKSVATESSSSSNSGSSSQSTSYRSSSSSQLGFEKGDIFVTGTFGYASKSNGATSEGTFAIQPGVGYFIKDNIAIGATIGFVNSSSKPVGGGSSASNSEFGIGLMARYYTTPASQFSLFAQGAFEFKSQSFDGGGSTTGFGINAKPGINYFVSPHFSLEATIGEIGFSSLKAKDATDANNDFNFGFNLREIMLGLNYKF
jgi:Outer membrane protein beta-barrel domain